MRNLWLSHILLAAAAALTQLHTQLGSGDVCAGATTTTKQQQQHASITLDSLCARLSCVK